VLLHFGDNSTYGKRKSLLEKFEVLTEDELVSKLEVVENINLSLVNNQFLKAKKGHVKNNDLQQNSNSNLIINCKTTDQICMISNIGKSYILDCRALKFGSIKGIAISKYLKLKENEKIIDAFKYHEKNKIVLASKEGFVFIMSSINLFSNKKSGKKIFNIKKNDEYVTSCLFDDKKGKYIAVFFKNELNNKLIIFSSKEIPILQKGSGLIAFKGRGYKLSAIYTLENDLVFYDYQKREFEININFKKYLSKRGKAGKLIKLKKIRFFRGFDNNFVL